MASQKPSAYIAVPDQYARSKSGSANTHLNVQENREPVWKQRSRHTLYVAGATHVPVSFGADAFLVEWAAWMLLPLPLNVLCRSPNSTHITGIRLQHAYASGT